MLMVVPANIRKLAVVSGGPMLPGRFHGHDVMVSQPSRQPASSPPARWTPLRWQTSSRSAARAAAPAPVTANTMNSLTEVLGMACRARTIPAAYTGARRSARQARRRCRPGPTQEDQAARHHDARGLRERHHGRHDHALNTVLYLTSSRRATELPAPLFDEICAARRTSRSFQPGQALATDLNEAGGIPVVMHELAKKNLIHLDALTITGTVGDRIKNAEVLDRTVIHSVDDPVPAGEGDANFWWQPRTGLRRRQGIGRRTGHADLHGQGEVLQPGDGGLRRHHGRRHPHGDVVVIRHEGPKGGPGMQEMLNPTAVITGRGLKVGLITDGRFSGANRRLCRPHSPEAMEGGPIALTLRTATRSRSTSQTCSLLARRVSVTCIARQAQGELEETGTEDRR